MASQQVRCALQKLFEEWGLPQGLRFDNGKPWANPQSRVPSPLALWLVGLGIVLYFGRPSQSTDNAVVERSHGILEAWAEPQAQANSAALQHNLDKFVHIQRAVYPSCQGQSRFAAYPQIHQIQRHYQADGDQALWQRQVVLDYVARFRFTRTVEKNGRITHFGRHYSLGRAYAAQRVTVYLDPQNGGWLIENRYGERIAQFLAEQFDYQPIANLQVLYQKG